MKELSLNIMDLVQNSITAQASVIEISVIELKSENRLSIDIFDNGTGISKDILEKVTDPFYTSRTTRSVGLGIPLYKQMVEQCNGEIAIASEVGKGTRLRSYMDLNHIDRQPMGDITGVMVLLFAANPGIQFIYTHQTDCGKYVLDTVELRNILGNEVKYETGILKYIKEMIQENLDEINTNC